jgi:Putative zinc-finger
MTNSNMTCAAFDEALPDYLEGTLDGSLRSAVEGHLRECVRCTGLVRDLRNIEMEAAKLPDMMPSRDLWQGIETRIAAPVIALATRPQRSRRFARTWMGIAAAALIASTAGITYTLTARSVRGTASPAASTSVATVNPSNQPASSAPQVVAAAPASQAAPPATSSARTGGGGRSSVGIQNASTVGTQTDGTPRMVNDERVPSEAIYSREIDMLQRIVTDRKTQLDSATVAIIERNLQIIDRAIEQSKAALARDPASRLLSDQLTHALDKKVELLRRTVMLPVNT